MKLNPNKQSGVAQVWFVIIGGVLVLHVVLVPVFLWIAWEHRITVRPGQAATLPAELTHPPATGMWAAPAFAEAAAPVAAPPVEPATIAFSIEPFPGGVAVTVPAWSSLWTSDTGLPDSWTWVADYYDVTVHVQEAGGQCGFFSVRPIARP